MKLHATIVDMNDQWTFQCETPKRHPLRDETSTDETSKRPPNPTDLGRISDETACLHMDQ